MSLFGKIGDIKSTLGNFKGVQISFANFTLARYITTHAVTTVRLYLMARSVDNETERCATELPEVFELDRKSIKVYAKKKSPVDSNHGGLMSSSAEHKTIKGSSNDCPILLFGEKSQREAIIKGYNKITGLEARENDGLSQFVCRSCARKISTFKEFKTLCRESDSKQRSYYSKSENTGIKRGKKLEESASGPTVSPITAHTSKKTRLVASPPVKIRLACRFQLVSSSTTGLIQIAPRPAVQTVQLSDKDSTLSRAVDDIAHKGKKRHESTDAT